METEDTGALKLPPFDTVVFDAGTLETAGAEDEAFAELLGATTTVEVLAFWDDTAGSEDEAFTRLLVGATTVVVRVEATGALLGATTTLLLLTL